MGSGVRDLRKLLATSAAYYETSIPTGRRVGVSGRRHLSPLLILPLPAAVCDQWEQSAAGSGSLLSSPQKGSFLPSHSYPHLPALLPVSLHPAHPATSRSSISDRARLPGAPRARSVSRACRKAGVPFYHAGPSRKTLELMGYGLWTKAVGLFGIRQVRDKKRSIGVVFQRVMIDPFLEIGSGFDEADSAHAGLVTDDDGRSVSVELHMANVQRREFSDSRG